MARPKQGYCKHCRSYVLTVRQRPKMFTHSVLLVISLGLWFPVWFYLAAFGTKYLCNRCGYQTR